MIGPAPTPFGIAMKIDVPWDQTNTRHVWKLTLHDEDGNGVHLDGMPEGEEGVGAAGEFEVGRPPGLTPGTAIDLPMALTVPPLPLPPGQRFAWHLTIDEEHQEGWTLSFNTRAMPGQGGPDPT